MNNEDSKDKFIQKVTESFEKVTEGPRKDITEAIDLFRKTNSRLVIFILVLFFLSVILCTLIVLLNSFHDWFMFLLYSVLASGILILHLIGIGKRRVISGLISLFFSLIIIIFFIIILLDKIPQQKTLINDEVTLRERINSFYIPIILFSITCIGLIVQFILEIKSKINTS